MARVELCRVGKTYPNGFVAVQAFDMDIASGEFVVLVGPSGCGKSTTLRMIAGLERISSGELRIGGRRVNELSPRQRDVAMVFQSYALYPHMTVFDNMAFALTLQKMPKAEIRQRVGEVAERLGISALLDRKPKQMSGGQRQRVAMGRAIVRRPHVFLFDEPLSNLDAKLRLQMRVELSRLHRSLGATSLYVTHDQVEAMTLADRIVLLEGGVVQQIGTPLDLFERPANAFVATFIGSPAMNLLDGEIAGGRLRCAGAEWPAPAEAPAGPVVVGVRPQHLRLGSGPGALRAEVEVVEPLGAESYVYCRQGDLRVIAHAEGLPSLRPGDPVELLAEPQTLHYFDPTTRVRR